MKGHVGDGARSGGIKAPVTGNQADATFLLSTTLGIDDACSFVSITFDSRYRLLDTLASQDSGVFPVLDWLVSQT